MYYKGYTIILSEPTDYVFIINPEGGFADGKAKDHMSLESAKEYIDTLLLEDDITDHLKRNYDYEN